MARRRRRTVPNDHIMGVYNRAPAGVRARRGRAALHRPRARPISTAWPASRSTRSATATPSWSQALKDQAEKLWHVSNIFRIPGQEELAAKLLRRRTFADVVFFTNSGTEAIECALKTARKYHAANGQPERIDIIGFDGAFHGRTYAAVNAARQRQPTSRASARACRATSSCRSATWRR